MSLKITENARDRSRGTLSPPSGAVAAGEGEVSQTKCTQCTPSPFVKSQAREDKRTPRRALQFCESLKAFRVSAPFSGLRLAGWTELKS